MTRVTVITPSYNQAQFIRATIDSVLTQDYADIEYLIMDGGSTDGTRAILEGISDPRVQWISEQDKGQTDALNKGLQRASGDILTFINSDDILLPGAVSFAVNYFQNHPDIDLIYGDAEIIDELGKVNDVWRSAPYSLSKTVLLQQTFIQQGTFWRRKSFAVDFDNTLQYTFDIDYWARAALADKRLEYVPGIRAQFRMHQASKSVSQLDRFYVDWQRTFDKIFEHPGLSAAVYNLRRRSNEHLEWTYAKLMWNDRNYPRSRILLRKFLKHPRLTWRLLANLMLLETYTRTRFSKVIAAVYARYAGYPISGFDT